MFVLEKGLEKGRNFQKVIGRTVRLSQANFNQPVTSTSGELEWSELVNPIFAYVGWEKSESIRHVGAWRLARWSGDHTILWIQLPRKTWTKG